MNDKQIDEMLKKASEIIARVAVKRGSEHARLNQNASIADLSKIMAECVVEGLGLCGLINN